MAGERKFPFFIDIFLYPFNATGVINLGIFIAVPVLLDFVNSIIPVILSILYGLVYIVIRIFIYLYMYWYFTECIRDSAEGFLRAPETMLTDVKIGDMFWQTVNVIGPLMFFTGPFVLYMLFAQRADVIFWLLLVCGAFFFPMALLAVLLRDPASGLNLRLLVRSIRSTFRQYSVLVLLFVLTIISISMIGHYLRRLLIFELLINAASIYLAFVAAHLLGRFYWRYQDKLNWGV